MTRSTPALINPAMLVWSRKQAGYTPNEAARKAKVKEDRLLQWEQGVEKPTIAQTRVLAAYYRRPLALFYLREPPKTYDAVADFRRLPGTFRRQETPELLWAIRQARFRRQVAIDLTCHQGGKPQRFGEKATLDDPPEQTAFRLRHLLKISLPDQIKLRTPHEAFNTWREAVESLGIFVFQVSKIKLSEMRALCLPDDPFPVILLNSADHPHGRVFSLMHEMAHLLLARNGEVGNPSDMTIRPDDQRIEVFTNAVAAAALLPREDMLTDSLVTREHAQAQWPDDVLSKLSGKYSVSRETILRRLVTLGLASEQLYQERRNYWEMIGSLYPKEQAGGTPPVAIRVLSRVGRAFGQLVLDGYRRGAITLNDVSNYFDMKPKWLHEFEQHLAGSSFRQRAIQ